MIYIFFFFGLVKGSTNLSVCKIVAAHSVSYMPACFYEEISKLPCWFLQNGM